MIAGSRCTAFSARECIFNGISNDWEAVGYVRGKSEVRKRLWEIQAHIVRMDASCSEAVDRF